MIRTVQLGQYWSNVWNIWCEQSVNRRIFAAIITVSGLTVLVKVVSAAKELAVAYTFGVSDALDAFVIAFLLPQFMVELIGGAMNVALIPTYVQVRELEGREAAQRLASTVLICTLGLIFFASVFLCVMAAYLLPVLASGFSPEKVELTRQLFFWLLPTLLFCGLGTTWCAILNAGERFALGALVPVVTPILTLFLLLGMGGHGGILTLAFGTVAGLALEAALLGWGLRRQGISLMPRWYGASPAVKQVFRQYAPTVGSLFLMGSTMLITQSMAATLGSGSVSALAYGSKVTTLLLGVGSLAVSTAVLPHFSRFVAVGDSAGFRHTLRTYARLVLIVAIPLTAILVFYSEPIVKVFFQRGAFTDADTQIVSQVQAIYLLQVPAYIIGILFVRVISSFRANHLLVWGTAVNLITCVISTYVFMRLFHVVGIALSISLMYFVSAGFLACAAVYLTKRNERLGIVS